MHFVDDVLGPVRKSSKNQRTSLKLRSKSKDSPGLSYEVTPHEYFLSQTPKT